MQEYISFFQQHLLLSAAFIVILILLIANEIRYRLSGIAKLSCQQVTQALNQEIGIVIDTRARNDFQRGHILGAINILESELLKEINKIEKYKDKRIILVDAMGQKSHSMALQLKKQGFVNTAMLNGGMQAWLAEGLPIVK